MFRLFRKFDVCTVGAGTRDVFIKSTHFEKERDNKAPDGFDACFPMGAKIPLDDVIPETGGGATNAAVTFSRFGLKTACVCAVGQDQNGQEIINVLKREKIDARGLQVHAEKKTSYSVILLSGTGQRSILAYRGAANDLDVNRVPRSRLNSRWLYLTSLGGDLKKNRAIITRASTRGSHLSWNPGNDELMHGLSTLKPLIKQTDILILNREEAALLTHEDPKNLNLIVKRLGSLPKAALIITDGGHGAYVFDIKTHKLLHSPALPGRRINTTGAGDAFGSAFTAAYIKTKNCETGLRAGLINSLGVITHMGAKAGILKFFPSKKSLELVRIHILSLREASLRATKQSTVDRHSRLSREAGSR